MSLCAAIAVRQNLKPNLLAKAETLSLLQERLSLGRVAAARPMGRGNPIEARLLACSRVLGLEPLKNQCGLRLTALGGTSEIAERVLVCDVLCWKVFSRPPLE